jgi:hypothetical protein
MIISCNPTFANKYKGCNSTYLENKTRNLLIVCKNEISVNATSHTAGARNICIGFADVTHASGVNLAHANITRTMCVM